MIMTRHFCCSIPVRTAIFVFSLLTFFTCGFVTVSAIWVLSHTSNPNYPGLAGLESAQEYVLMVITIIYGFACLAAIAGYIGSIIHKRKLVAFYSIATIIGFLLQTGVDTYFLYTLWHNTGFDDCADYVLDKGNNPVIYKMCRQGLRNIRLASTVVLPLTCLIQLYIAVVIRRYVKQLDDDEYYSAYKSNYNLGPAGKGTSPEQAPLPAGHYPYSDPQHAFGSHNA